MAKTNDHRNTGARRAAKGCADAELRHEKELLLEQLGKRGWFGRAPGEIVHPTDSNLSVFYNPLTSELLLAPKLVDMATMLYRTDHPGHRGAPDIAVVLEYALRAADEISKQQRR